MHVPRLKQTISKPLIVTADDGTRVFFPFGPLRGYVLPNRAYESVVGTLTFWLTISSIGSFLAIFIISKAFDIGGTFVLLVVVLCHHLWYFFRTKRIARYLALLPHAGGMRTYSRAIGPYEMWKRIWFFVFTTVIFGTLAYLAPLSVESVLFIAGTVISALGVCLFGRALYLEGVEDSKGTRNIVPANHPVNRNGGS